MNHEEFSLGTVHAIETPFLMKAMAPKEITLVDIYSSIVPFVIIMTIVLGLVILFPQITMWLPEFYFGK